MISRHRRRWSAQEPLPVPPPLRTRVSVQSLWCLCACLRVDNHVEPVYPVFYDEAGNEQETTAGKAVKNQDRYWITSSLTIPASELSFSFSRSSGSGGQHVNKVNSRVSLWFDVDASRSLTQEQKERIRKRLAGRVNKQGILRLDADRQRSQRGNREDVINRFIALLQETLRVRKTRRRTRPGRGAKERRLQSKKYRSRLKQQRVRKYYSDE